MLVYYMILAPLENITFINLSILNANFSITNFLIFILIISINILLITFLHTAKDNDFIVITSFWFWDYVLVELGIYFMTVVCVLFIKYLLGITFSSMDFISIPLTMIIFWKDSTRSVIYKKICLFLGMSNVILYTKILCNIFYIICFIYVEARNVCLILKPSFYKLVNYLSKIWS